MTTDDHDSVMVMLVILMVATSGSDHRDRCGDPCDCTGDDMTCVVAIDGGNDMCVCDNDGDDMCVARVADNGDDVCPWL